VVSRIKALSPPKRSTGTERRFVELAIGALPSVVKKPGDGK
jgi:hypothetical protein